jgi:hypothetical protein
MLTIRDFQDYAVEATIGIDVDMVQPGGQPGFIHNLDPLVSLLTTGYFTYGSYVTSLSSLLSGIDHSVYSVLSGRPNSYTYANSANYDSENYSSSLGVGISAVRSLLSGVPISQGSPPSNEHFTRHYTFSGKLQNRLVSSPRSNVEEIFHNWVWTSNFHGYPGAGYHFHDSAQLDPEVYVTDFGYNLWSFGIENLLDNFPSNFSVFTPQSYGSSYVFDYSNYKISYNGTSMTIAYDLHHYAVDALGNKLFPYGQAYDWYSRGFKISIMPFTPSNIVNVMGNFHIELPTYFSWDSADFSYYGLSVGSGLYQTYSSRLLFRSYSSYVPRSNVTRYSYNQSYDSDSLLIKFNRSIRPYTSDVLASSYISSSAAADNLHDRIDSAVFQSLSKLNDIGSRAYTIFNDARLASIDHSIQKLPIREALRLINIRTPSSIEIRAISSALSSWIPDLIAATNSFVFTGVTEGRGSFSFDIPDGIFNRDRVHLSTRSKIVMRVGIQYLLSSLLGEDIAKLFLSLVNSLSKTPLLSMIEGFSKIRILQGQALNALFIGTLPAYYVHTYCLSSPLTGAELDNWKLSNIDNSVPASLRVYIRDVSLYYPTPRDSRFNYQYPSVGLSNLRDILLHKIVASVHSLS